MTVGIVIAIFTINTWARDGNPDLSFMKLFSIGALAATIALALWDNILWRIPIVQRLPKVPRNVRGTWKGELASIWIDSSTGLNLAPKEAYLVIRQTATLVSVRLLTNESVSKSSLASVSCFDETFELTYVYFNRPHLKFDDKSKMHHGSTVLSISGVPARRLRGHYWTDRNSKGELEMTHRRKKFAEDYAEAQALFDGKV
ncbi:hypothetical protein [Stackebrandtia nassauensis]|uniref:Cap15 family cyclic dinucleotide receptor domain-containing protein n=1 Tax=Stackebrandtia nassauensis TaxID=283811 RepID=UPI00118686F7|nr:hypothetical protein [Stackebrandtia nassauensis]